MQFPRGHFDSAVDEIEHLSFDGVVHQFAQLDFTTHRLRLTRGDPAGKTFSAPVALRCGREKFADPANPLTLGKNVRGDHVWHCAITC